MNDEEKKAEWLRLRNALFVPAVIAVLIASVFALQQGLSLDFYRAGIFPRNSASIFGLVSIVFIHGSWTHLLNNLLGFSILSTCLYYFYRQIASRILLFSIVGSGIILWCIGRANWHIGASGLVYALASFLFFSGLLRRHIPLIAISLTVIFLYGSMIWHIFPWQADDPISWEGHLSGAITGICLSVIYRKAGPQRPPNFSDEDEDGTDNSDAESEIFPE